MADQEHKFGAGLRAWIASRCTRGPKQTRDEDDIEAALLMEACVPELLKAGVGEGHGEPCYYCQELCNAFTGNPGMWPIPLCHADEPGVVKWHHIGCVSERLAAAARMPKKEEALVAQRDEARKKWQDYEHDYILPAFRIAERDGFDLQELVLAAAGKNCNVILWERLQRERDEARAALTKSEERAAAWKMYAEALEEAPFGPEQTERRLRVRARLVDLGEIK